MLHEFAPAKLNLFLHVLGRREDGYHLLESLVTFADVGDFLTLDRSKHLGLSITGPFSRGLAGEGDNLVIKAARSFAAHIGGARLGAFTLEKNLPVASGIGGGSSNAAAALRLLARANGVSLDDPRLLDAARPLGADVPVCLEPGVRLMRGIGHDLGPLLNGRAMPALLVNPGVGVSTGSIFTRLGLRPGQRCPTVTTPELALSRNDLAPPAIALAPVIGEVLARLDACVGVRLVRMSGSGATCFALFENADARDAARAAIARLEDAVTPVRWWIAPCEVQLPA